MQAYKYPLNLENRHFSGYTDPNSIFRIWVGIEKRVMRPEFTVPIGIFRIWVGSLTLNHCVSRVKNTVPYGFLTS